MPTAKNREIKRAKTNHRPLWIKVTLVAFLSLSILLVNNRPFQVFSASVDELKQQQEERQKRLNELSEQISQQQKEINKLVKEQNTLQNQIALFNVQINQATAQIAATETQIEIASNKIAELNQSIAEKEQQIDANKERLKEMIRTMYEMDRANSALLALMNNDNLSDFLNAVSQLKNLQGKSYELLQEIKALKLVLEQDRAEVEKQKNDLEELRVSLIEQRRILEQQVAAKDELLRITRGREQTYRQLLAQTQAEEDKIEREIQELENQIRAQLGQRTSPGSKGLFKYWPMDGTITQRYGRTGFTALGYNFHNGIDIAAPAGQPIVAVYDGTVLATDSSNYAYGNWVTIKHDLPNGRSVVTLYAHMLRISVKPGQAVKAGQVIGTEGNTGNTTRLLYGPHRGFHLHFTVFDAEGFQIVDGQYGQYRVPAGYTYDPMDFL